VEADARGLQASGAVNTVSFTAIASSSGTVTLSVASASGASLGGVTFSTPNCVASPSTFCGDVSSGPPAQAGSPTLSNGGAIAGGVIGALLLVGVAAGAVLYYRHRRAASAASGGPAKSAKGRAGTKDAASMDNPMTNPMSSNPMTNMSRRSLGAPDGNDIDAGRRTFAASAQAR